MDRQIAGIHAQAEWGDVQFAEFDPPAGDLFSCGDYPAAYFLLKGIGGDIPAEQRESNQAEDKNKQSKSFRRMRRRCGGSGFTQRLLISEADSGLIIWLVERRLASHPESSSFIFFSASKFLILPETSASGAAPLPASCHFWQQLIAVIGFDCGSGRSGSRDEDVPPPYS